MLRADTGPVRARRAVHPNDAFAAAVEIPAAGGSATGTNADATGETGEPANGALNTVWYTWTPAANTTVTIHTCEPGSDFDLDPVLNVYTGTLSMPWSAQPATTTDRASAVPTAAEAPSLSTLYPGRFRIASRSTAFEGRIGAFRVAVVRHVAASSLVPRPRHGVASVISPSG